MKRIRMVALCLVAAFAMSAVGASVASANPEFFGKGAVGGTVGAVKFKGTLTNAYLEGKSGTKITCTGGTATGEVTGVTTTKNNLTTFTGCETSGFKCNSAGQGEGVIQTNTLEGTLGALTATLPGIRLYNEATGRGGELAAFSCASGSIAVSVKGSVIGSLSGGSGHSIAEGKLATSNKLAFAETKGIQKYTKFVGELTGEQLESKVGTGGYEDSGQFVTATLTTTPSGQLGVTL